MGTTKSASLIYPFRKNATGPVARAETKKRNTCRHLSQAAPCLRHILLPCWTLIEAPFPEILVKWGKRGISPVTAKLEFRFLDYVDVTSAGTFVIYC